MTRAANRFVCGGLFLAALAATLVLVQASNRASGRGGEAALAKAPAGPASKGLEELLKETGLAYSRREDPASGQVLYRVTFEGGGEVSVIVVTEPKPWTWKYKDGSAVRPIACWSTITPVPRDFRPPPAMLKKMAELNNRLPMGSIGLGNDAIFHNNGFFSRNLDGETLLFYLASAHFDRLNCRKELVPFLTEGKE
jgi:hypothetical protein